MVVRVRVEYTQSSLWKVSRMNGDSIFETEPVQVIKPNFRPLTYLASPYSYKHADPAIVKKVQSVRFETCTRAAAWCIDQFSWNVFSPITHSHPLHMLYPGIRGDWPFWEKIDTEYLNISNRIVVLTIPGWEKSTGVTAESKIARELGLEFLYVAPRDGSFVLTRDPQPLFEHRTDTDL